ncbi:hypothetical protein P3L10_010050 [Capsicum annuum]
MYCAGIRGVPQLSLLCTYPYAQLAGCTETSSSHGGVTATGGVQVPVLPRLHKNVCNSMFFC